MAKRAFATQEALHAHIEAEAARWLDFFANEELPDDRTSISIQEVVDAHFHLIHYFADIGEGIGGIGPKDPPLLISALSRQFAEFGGKERYEKPLEKVASLLFGLVKNHPFHDANKRTAFLTSILHLQKIGRTPTATHLEYEDFVVHIADDNLGKYTNNDNEKVRDSEQCVRIISEFLRKNTRDIDKKHKIVTYYELSQILSNFHLYLDNPKGNRIDVLRKASLSAGGQPVRICKIGFHGWSREVSRTDIAIIREAAKFDVEHGYDFQSFFNGAETPLALIKKYEEPLRRLAFR